MHTVVHGVFVEKGYFGPDPGRPCIRVFECLPKMAAFVAKVHMKILVVAVTVANAGEMGLRSDHACQVAPRG